ncbi:hypothetical protein ACLBWT_02730 [Paenibacillus sp. D51F]
MKSISPPQKNSRSESGTGSLSLKSPYRSTRLKPAAFRARTIQSGS